jgi:hypothetical protein
LLIKQERLSGVANFLDIWAKKIIFFAGLENNFLTVKRT